MKTDTIYQRGWEAVPFECPKCSGKGLERSLHREDWAQSLYLRCTLCGYWNGWTPEQPIFHAPDDECGLITFRCKTNEIPEFAREPNPGVTRVP